MARFTAKNVIKCSVVRRIDVVRLMKQRVRRRFWWLEWVPWPGKSEQLGEIQLVENVIEEGSSTFYVQGVSAAGNPVDISEVATLAPPPTSSDTSIITIDPPVGMNFTMRTVGPVTPPGQPVNVLITATWNDGSLGPYYFDMPVTVKLGLLVIPGNPVMR